MPDKTDLQRTQSETQDMGVQEAHKPDKAWARTQPVQMIPTQDRLDEEHSVVDITNTSPMQKHIVVDRHLVGHELNPGQTVRGVEMLNKEIKYFLRQRDDRRKGRDGRPLPKHPIVIADSTLRDEDAERPRTRPLHERLGRPVQQQESETEHVEAEGRGRPVAERRRGGSGRTRADR